MTDTNQPTFCKINLKKETLEELKEIQERAFKLRELLGDCPDFDEGDSGHHCLNASKVPLTDGYGRTPSGKPVHKFTDENIKKGLIKPNGKKKDSKEGRNASVPNFRKSKL